MTVHKKLWRQCMDWAYDQQRFFHASLKALESLLGSERDEEVRCWEWWSRELVLLPELLEELELLELLEEELLLLILLDDESSEFPLESESGRKSRSSWSKDA